MKKFIFFVLILFIPIIGFGLELPEIYSEVVLIYDLNDEQILLEKNSEQQRSIASLTKIATVITAIDNIPDLNQKVTITSEMLAGIPGDASMADLVVGDTVTVMDLIYAAMLPSGADATHALAYVASGSIPKFVDKMNELAKSLGANNTHFVNVTGYTAPNHYSTAQDVLKILKYAFDNPQFLKAYKTRKYIMSNNQELESTVEMFQELYNLNTSRILGSKTGYTDDAGQCISVLVNVNGHEMIIITLKAPYHYGAYYHLKDVETLLGFLDKNYDEQVLIKQNEEVKSIPVLYSDVEEYKIEAQEKVTKFLPSDYDTNLIKIKYDGLDKLTFLNKKGSIIGNIEYYYDNKLIQKEEVILTNNFSINFQDIISQNKNIAICFTIFIIFLLIVIGKRKKQKKKR